MKTAALLQLAIVGVVVGLVVYLVKKLGLADEGALNPASQNNVVNRAANSIWQSITGDANQTIGGSAHDTMNPRAGLAANEYSPAPGIIVTQIGAGANYRTEADATADAEDAYLGLLLSGGFGETSAGAVTGRGALGRNF